MTILSRYIIAEILKAFAVVMAVVIIIYVAVDFFEKIDDFVGAGVPLSRMAVFFLFKIPLIVVQTAPVGVLIASLVVFGLMNRRNEITALKSSGIGPASLFKPAAVVGMGCCVLLFIVSEIVVPHTISRANYIWLQQVRQKTSSIDQKNNIWLKDDRTILHIRHYQPREKKAFDVVLHDLDGAFRVTRRIDAARGVYDGEQWVLRNVLDQQFDAAGNVKFVEFRERLKINLDLLPEDLDRASESADEMGFAQLLDRIRQIEGQGYSVVPQRVDLHAKLSFPFVCLLMGLIGAALGVMGRTRGGITANAAYGVGASFVYWIFHSFCISLGYGGMLPPLVAAWSANLVFGSATAAVIFAARR